MGSLEKMEADQKIETDGVKTELQEKMEIDQMIETDDVKQEKMESEQMIEVTSTSSNVEQDDDVNEGEKNGQLLLTGELSEELGEVEKESDAKKKR